MREKTPARRRRPRSPFLNTRFSTAVQEFGIALKNTGLIQHRGNKGASREESLRAFFKERMPSKYAVAQGEVVDLEGHTSPQLDIMLYDQSENFALVSGTTEILAAEALLGSVEVKSILTKVEIEKSVAAAQKLRELRPYGKALAGVNIGESPQPPIAARYFHTIFAYDTDLATDSWLDREGTRLKTLCGDAHVIDGVYVLNRGFLNIPHNSGLIEDDNGAAITNFYFSILHFIQRESARRKETPYFRYAMPPRNAWFRI